MSEQLKSYKMVDKDYCDDSFCIVPSDVYLKSEVDNVIAEKDSKIKRLEKCEKWMKDHFFCEEIASVEVRHQKYKRCLAMARWCDAEIGIADTDGDYKDIQWYQKWYKRWIELAEQFKEGE